MKHTLFATALLCAIGLAQAAKLPLYDSFSGDEIDRGKWNEAEAWRFTEGGKARLGRWIYGSTGTDAGVLFDTWGMNIAGGNAPKGLQATIRVTDIGTIEGCAANPSPSRARARIIATYFNIRPGGPLPNDRTGDILAQIIVNRNSDSSDGPDVLRVDGYLSECTTSDCNGGVDRAAVPLGTVMRGDAVTVRIDWSKSGNLFRFSRDGGTPVDVSYTDADGISSSLPFAQIALRNWVANCQGTRVKSGLAAEFDDVRYNQ